MDIDPTAIAIITIAVTVGSLAKGITGLGLPLIGVPVMATFLGVEQAVVVMVLPTFVTNLWLIREHRQHASETRHLPVMVVLGFVGTVVGTVVLTTVDPSIPAIILSVVILLYLALRLLRPTFTFSERATARTAPAVGLLGGLLQGSTGVSGPVIATYLHGFGLAREAFVLAATTMFQSFALVQMGTFVVLGRYDPTNLALTLAALVPILIMLPVGIRLGRRLDPKHFEKLLLLILLASSAKLLFDGISGMT